MLLPFVNSLQRLFTSHILLYHSTYANIPADLKSGLHNVAPDELHRQVSWLKRRFQFVEIDDFFRDPRPGRIAITFDDGYECVFTEAVPVLEDLQVPCTVFVNGSSLTGRPFWRDKIRFLINRSLVPAFLAHYRARADEARLLREDNFYKMTKDPRINSHRLDEEIDRFLAARGTEFRDLSYCVRDARVMKPSPYLTIGNHSLDHYVLSSLSRDEQAFEIQQNHEVLAGLGLKTSKIFSIPFGCDRDFNQQTISLIHDLGYTGFLYSRELLNLGGRGARTANGAVASAERYMVPPTLPSLQKRLFRLGLKTVKRRWLPARAAAV